LKKSKLIGLAGAAASAAKNPDMSFIAALKAFVRMMISAFRGRYSPKTINLLIGTAVILYVISPLDFIPGIILDDAAIVFFAMKYFRKELNRFLEWEKAQKMKPIITEATIVND
jgi:uncharacterized membrane protein YkvA (DUF1232 family)